MGGTVELPIWFVVLAAILAAIGLFDRLLVPTVRFMLRRRINEAIDELNTRLRLRIQPFKLARRDGLIDRIVYDQEVMRAAEARAEETGAPRAVVMEKVKAYAREIVPSFSAYAYFRLGTRAARFLSRLLYRVRLGYMNDEALRQVDPDSAVVFVINHRSNMDYVLVTYLAAGSSALSYAVGEWARVVFLQSMIRSMGAYFVRRDSSDPLYRRVLARYVQLATAEGVTQAVFPEGGLTRDGALRPPKLGLLAYIVGRFDPRGERDVVFIPVGLNYDRVIEDRNLTKSIAREAGVSYARFGLKAVAAYVAQSLWLKLTGRWYRFGYASVSFGEPVSLRRYLDERALDLRALPEERRFAAIADLGRLLMDRIGAVVPVLPVALVATVFERAAGEALTLIDIKGRAAALIEELKGRHAHIHVPRQDLDYAIESGLRMLTLRRLVADSDGLYRAIPREAVLVRYYANSIAHHFAAQGTRSPAAADRVSGVASS
jgi:glycerol-3-phosphate O-acyltransferase